MPPGLLAAVAVIAACTAAPPQATPGGSPDGPAERPDAPLVDAAADHLLDGPVGNDAPVDAAPPDTSAGSDHVVVDAETPDIYGTDTRQELPPECKNSGAIVLGSFGGPTSEVSYMVLDEASIWIALSSGALDVLGVWSLPRAGGPPVRRYTPETFGTVGGLALDGDYLYFTTSTTADHPSTLVRMARASGRTEVLAATDVPDAIDIAVDGAAIYWTTTTGPPAWDGSVSKVSKSGGPVTTLTRGKWTSGIVVDGPVVYYTRTDLSGSTTGIYKLPAVGGQAAFLVAGDTRRLAANAQYLFGLAGYSLRRVDKVSGAAMELSPMADTMGTHSLAIDESHVYFTNLGYWSGHPLPSAGKVQKVPRGGGPAVEIAT